MIFEIDTSQTFNLEILLVLVLWSKLCELERTLGTTYKNPLKNFHIWALLFQKKRFWIWTKYVVSILEKRYHTVWPKFVPPVSGCTFDKTSSERLHYSNIIVDFFAVIQSKFLFSSVCGTNFLKKLIFPTLLLQLFDFLFIN